MILKNFKIVEFSKEIKNYLASAKGLSADTLTILAELSLTLDSVSEVIIKKEDALKRGIIDIFGEHNINPNGTIREELINALNEHSKNLFKDYANKIYKILEEEQNIDIEPIEKASVLPCDDALAYKAALHVAILSQRDKISNG